MAFIPVNSAGSMAGAQGAQASQGTFTPESLLERRRQLALLLSQQGQEPADSALGVGARLAQTLAGKFQERGIRKKEEQNAEIRERSLAEAMASQDPNVAAMILGRSRDPQLQEFGAERSFDLQDSERAARAEEAKFQRDREARVADRAPPGIVQKAQFLHPDDPEAQRAFVKQASLKSGVTVNVGQDGTTAPVRRPEPTVSTPEFDVIQKATGPVDTFLRVAQRLPLIAPVLGEAGTEQRQSRLIVESVNNDLRRAFAINSSRISNFDLNLAQKLLPASLGVFTSEQGAVSDLVQLQKLIDEDIAQNLEASRSQFLTDSDRSEAQQIVNALSSASDRIGGILTARQLAVTKIGGKPIGDLSPQELESLDPANLTDEQLQAVVAARRLANGR